MGQLYVLAGQLEPKTQGGRNSRTAVRKKNGRVTSVDFSVRGKQSFTLRNFKEENIGVGEWDSSVGF